MQFLKDRSGWLGLSFVVIAVCIIGAVCSARSGVEVESSGVYRSGEDILGEKETLPAGDVQGEKEDLTAAFSSEPSEAAGGVSAGVSSSAPEEGSSGAGKTAPLICVFVSGAVEKEGVYRLPEGARVYQAVEAAGGFRADADTSYVNLALILGDEDVIRIPAKEEGKRRKQPILREIVRFGEEYGGREHRKFRRDSQGRLRNRDQRRHERRFRQRRIDQYQHGIA